MATILIPASIGLGQILIQGAALSLIGMFGGNAIKNLTPGPKTSAAPADKDAILTAYHNAVAHVLSGADYSDADASELKAYAAKQEAVLVAALAA